MSQVWSSQSQTRLQHNYRKPCDTPSTNHNWPHHHLVLSPLFMHHVIIITTTPKEGEKLSKAPLFLEVFYRCHHFWDYLHCLIIISSFICSSIIICSFIFSGIIICSFICSDSPIFSLLATSPDASSEVFAQMKRHLLHM